MSPEVLNFAFEFLNFQDIISLCYSDLKLLIFIPILKLKSPEHCEYHKIQKYYQIQQQIFMNSTEFVIISI